MKTIYRNIVFIIIAAGAAVLLIKHSKDGGAFAKISDFYGGWSVVETQKFQGTLISDKKFGQLMGKPLIIEKDCMNFFGVEITSPTYEYRKISNKTVEGVIGDRTTSAFYGFHADRKFIHQFRIIKNNEAQGLFEVLSKNKLLFMVAGRIIIVEPKK